MNAILFLVGMIAGMMLMGYAAMQDRKEKEKQHNEAMRLAKKELDDAELRIEQTDKELIIKQNVIDSNNETINRLLRENTRLKKKKNETDNINH